MHSHHTHLANNYCNDSQFVSFRDTVMWSLITTLRWLCNTRRHVDSAHSQESASLPKICWASGRWHPRHQSNVVCTYMHACMQVCLSSTIARVVSNLHASKRSVKERCLWSATGKRQEEHTLSMFANLKILHASVICGQTCTCSLW